MSFIQAPSTHFRQKFVVGWIVISGSITGNVRFDSVGSETWLKKSEIMFVGEIEVKTVLKLYLKLKITIIELEYSEK